MQRAGTRQDEGIHDTDDRRLVFRYGELFCGPGGLALGAMRARIRSKGRIFSMQHEWASDYDRDSCDTYIRNICPNRPASVICTDVKGLEIESLGHIDAFAYGFPCNDFSHVGERKGFNGTFGPLYTYGVKVLAYYKPVFFVAENVSGIASANNGYALRKILSDLANAGPCYNLTVHIYRFEEYGVPQNRRRMIIVGIDRGLSLKFQVPAPTHLYNPRSVREALENPPIPSDALNNEYTNQSETVVQRLRHIRPGENVWKAILPDELKLNVKKARLSHIYRRLHPDRPSYTITGSGGGGTHVYHWEQPRALTNRERARIQAFDDDFIFEGSKESVRKQIGMAVPPVMSKVIFESVLKTLSGVSYDSVPANCPLRDKVPQPAVSNH